MLLSPVGGVAGARKGMRAVEAASVYASAEARVIRFLRSFTGDIVSGWLWCLPLERC